MNIVPSYPNLVPLALQPAVEAARRDTQQRGLIPAARQGEASAKESQAGSEKDKARSSDGRPLTYQADGSLRGAAMPQGVVTAVDDQRKDNQQGQSQDQSKNQSQEQSSSESAKQPSGREATRSGDAQSQAEQEAIEALKQRDQEVRTHEQAHQSAGGQYASSPSYSTQRGPDGESYAVGGEVQIDISAESEPAATIRKMQQVRTAALAPAEPSSQDHAVAAKASRLESEARAELQSQQAKGAVVGGSAQNEASGSSDSNSDSQISEPKVEQKSATMARRGDVIANRYQLAWQPQGDSRVSRYA